MSSQRTTIPGSNLPVALRWQALIDALERTRNGMTIHLPLWTLIGWVSGLVKTHPAFFWMNVALFLLALFHRLVLASRVRSLSDNADRTTSFSNTFVALYLGMGIHWGLLAAIATYRSEFEGIRVPLWLVATGICAAGTTKLAFLRSIRIGAPISLIVPTMLVLLLFPSRMNGFVLGGMIILLLYILDSSKRISDDYWSAALAHWELERRSFRLQLALEVGNIGISEGDLITGITHCDGRARAAFGLRSDTEVRFQSLISAVHPEDRETVDNLIRATLVTDGDGEFDAEFRAVGLDDGICRWLIAKGRVTFEKRGLTHVPVRFLGTVLDVTEKILAEREMSDNQRRAREILERTTDAVIMLNFDGEFTYLNPNAIRLIADGRDLMGKTLWGEFPDAVIRQFATQFKNVMDSGSSCQFEEFYPEPLNKWFEVHIYPMQNGIAVFFHDSTERHQAEEALIRSEKLAAAARMAASVSHGINNPLEAVTNLLYLLDQDNRISQTGREFLHEAQAELARVSQIAVQTLQFYRQSTYASEILIEDQLDLILGFYKSRLDSASITVMKRYRHHTPMIAFEGELRQVFTNLLGNAVDALADPGDLFIRTRFMSGKVFGCDYVAVTIADSGTGMSASTLAMSFEPFFSTKGITGTGLGLWVSKSIIEKHGGVIRARSRDYGSRTGSVFMTWIPIIPATTQSDIQPMANPVIFPNK